MQLHPKKIDLSLGRVERLLAALGNPQDRLPPVIHVAGTNGKGSTVATMRACLEAAGYRVHVYISPHLVRFHERIRLAGELIDEDALLALLDECERANGGEPITFFEITTSAAFLAFRANAGRCRAARNRAWRPARCDQCDPPSGGHGDHADLARSSGLSRRHGRGDRRREGRHPETRRHRRDRPAAGRGDRRHRGPRRGHRGAALPLATGNGGATRRLAVCAMRVRAGGSTCRRLAARSAPDRQRRRRASPVSNNCRVSRCRPLGNRGRVAPDRLAGAAAATARAGRWPKPAASGGNCGWTAGTTPAPARCSAQSPADWRDRPLDLVVGMLNTKDSGGFLRAAGASCAHTPRGHDTGRGKPHARRRRSRPRRARCIEAAESESVEAALRANISTVRTRRGC